ncbi:MAG: transglutaminase domain-containing protein [Planctomycetes bacterium]|nr:transglutaminase domain-containing protein [Planctomycetota bacterium]
MKRLNLNSFLKVLTVYLFALTTSVSIAETETDYLAILLQGKKIGHAVHIRAVENDKVITTESVSMTLGRGGQAVTITSQEIHIETPDGTPLGFEMTMTTSGTEQKTVGTVANGKVTTTRQVMGQAQERTIDWPQGALLNEGLRLLQEKRGLKPGTSYTASVFRPDMMMALPAAVQIGEMKKIDLFGRPLNLTEVITTLSIQGQPITMTGYVDKEFKAMKTLVPMMGMEMEMVACDKSFALSEVDSVDFLEKLSIASPVKLMNLHTIESVSYTLKPTTDKKLQLPVSPCQSVEPSETEIIVTVTRLKPAKDIPFPYTGNDAEAMDALKATDYLQCDNEKVIDLAKTAVKDAPDTAAAARQIEAFVDGYITQKDLSVGYASAAEVAETRQGDCSEHAVLAAAMCRAVGIPARIVCGVVYADLFLSKQSIFGGHMWVEVYIGDTWIGLDATRSEQGGFGPGHIALARGNGEPTDFFGLVNTLGCFEIEKITLTKKKEIEKTTTE